MVIDSTGSAMFWSNSIWTLQSSETKIGGWPINTKIIENRRDEHSLDREGQEHTEAVKPYVVIQIGQVPLHCDRVL